MVLTPDFDSRPVISFQHVWKTYPTGTEALRDINLVVPEGDFVFLVGPSGAGKSTMVRLLIREEKPSKGKIFVEGVELGRMNRRKLPYYRRKIGLVFQDFKLLPNLTVYENVAFALRVLGEPDRLVQSRAAEALDTVGLAGKEQTYPSNLSGGEQQRVAIARALVHAPRMIIADEPTGNLDPATAWEIMQLFLRINSRGATVVMATHNREIVDLLRRRVVAIDAGQSFWRNLAVSLAAVVSITLILILAGVNLLVGHALSQVLDGFRDKVSVISINVADDTSLASVYSYQAQLAADPRVGSVRFITKDEALANFAKDPNNAVLAQQLDGNPLDAKLEVRVRNLSDVASIDTLARQWSGVDPTNPTNYQGDFVKRMLQLSQWLNLAGVGLLAILVVVSVVIVMNTIRTAVYHRRKEIEVMKLVGATVWFVRGPFVIEGVMTGLIAASIALLLLVIAYPPAVQQFKNDIAFIPLSYDPAFLSSLARDLLLGGALMGALGSYIGVRRYVRI